MPSRTYDHALLLKDAGAVTADGAATVAGQPRFIDVGDAVFEGRAVIDASAIDLVTGDETYRVIVQGSATSNFAAPKELASRVLTSNGRTEIPFSNEDAGVTYRYLRAFLDTGGTTPSVNPTIFIAKA